MPIIYGNLEYEAETRKLILYVEGNTWVKENAEGLEDIPGLNVADQEERTAFMKAAAPGGEGIQSFGFELVRGSLPMTVLVEPE